MEELYTQAYLSYQCGDYETSKRLFTELIAKDPMEKAYWIGLASTSQMQKEFSQSSYGWAIVQFLDPENPDPYLHAAECLLSLGQKEEAQKALKEGKQKASHNKDLLEKMENLLQEGNTSCQ
ncbi:MAG: tetratricopeptide repeat protein [Chlamydiota bacterium]